MQINYIDDRTIVDSEFCDRVPQDKVAEFIHQHPNGKIEIYPE